MNWAIKMAWRDSRTYRRRLLLFFSCIAMGVAALVAIRSVGVNLERAVREQARTLLGSDLEIRSRTPFDAEGEALIDSIGGEQVRQVRFASMVYFPRVDGTRLIEVRAENGRLPFYGQFTTEPATAADRHPRPGVAMVDDALMLQYGVQVGDSLRLGQMSFVIGGRVKAISGESMAVMDVSPRVFIALSDLEATELVRQGSIVSYRVHFKLPAATDIGAVVERIRSHRNEEAAGISYETVASRERRMGRTMGNLYRYLSLVGFVALLLGCVGVASAVHVYIRQKLSTVAVLRCLGARPRQAFSIYAFQTAAMGALGSVVGAIVGIGAQHLIPIIGRDLLPVEVRVSTDYASVIEGIGVGTLLSLAFSLLPLVSVRKISPLMSLRASFETPRKGVDRVQLAIAVGIAGVVTGLAVLQMGGLRAGLGVTAGIGGAFLLLALCASVMTRVMRRFLPRSWPYPWRQGAANLFRPNNQTRILVIALGLGTFLIGSLYVVQDTLLNQVSLAGGKDRPNLVLFDVQVDQVDEVRNELAAFGLPAIHAVPVVTMRLAAINGSSVKEILADDSRDLPRWTLTREYRSTYRDSLFDSERVVGGTWVGQAEAEAPLTPVSLATDVAQRLRVGLGDSLVFDVQGVTIPVIVSSLREIDWQRVQPNFWVVFPTGVLEYAPQFSVFTTRVSSAEQSADLQRRLVKRFPNVSVIDLGLVLRTVDSVLDKVAFVIRFMALFSVVTGLVVLSAAVISSRYQRIQESVLLRTLGASRKQILRVLLTEYLFLGALGGAAGIVLAVGGGWMLSTFAFDTPFTLPGPALAAVFGLVAALTVLLGMANSRGIVGRPPLEVLRAEV